MDAETRHQLKQNELAEALARLRSLDKSVIYAIAGVAIGLLIWGAYYTWNWQATRAEQQEWSRIFLAGQESADGAGAADTLRVLAAELDEPAADVARLRAALVSAVEAAQGAELDDEALRRALSDLQRLVQRADLDAVFKAPAWLAIAKIHENLREFDEAAKAYEALQSDYYAGFPQQQIATVRLTGLERLRESVTFVAGSPPETVGPGLPPNFAPTPSNIDIDDVPTNLIFGPDTGDQAASPEPTEPETGNQTETTDTEAGSASESVEQAPTTQPSAG